MKRRYWNVLYALLLMAIIIVFVSIPIDPFGIKTTGVSEVLKHKKGEAAAIEKILTKWVFENSSKISFQTAREIVVAAMKTEKPLLMLSLIEVESNFVPSALSTKGAMGLTQVMPIHSKLLIDSKIIKDKRDLFDISSSIQAGNLILNGYLKDSKGNVTKAFELYLGGKDGAYLHRILVNIANLYTIVP